MKSKGSAHVLLGEERWKNLDMFLLRKGNLIMINEFRYGQIWKIRPSPLSLSLYSTFKSPWVQSHPTLWWNKGFPVYLQQFSMLLLYLWMLVLTSVVLVVTLRLILVLCQGHYTGFSKSVRVGGYSGEWIFLLGGENLRSDLDNLNFSQSKNSILWILNTNWNQN